MFAVRASPDRNSGEVNIERGIGGKGEAKNVGFPVNAHIVIPAFVLSSRYLAPSIKVSDVYVQGV